MDVTRRIRTCALTERAHLPHSADADGARNVRLIAKLTRSVLATETFEDYGSVREAVKVRCAALRIDYRGGVVDRALDLVSTNRPLFLERPRVVLTAPPSSPFGRFEAADVLARVLDHFGPRAFKPLPRMPHFARLDARVREEAVEHDRY